MLEMLFSAGIGGYAGARVARRLPPVVLRIGVTVLSAGVTAGFFWRLH